MDMNQRFHAQARHILPAGQIYSRQALTVVREIIPCQGRFEPRCIIQTKQVAMEEMNYIVGETVVKLSTRSAQAAVRPRVTRLQLVVKGLVK